MKALSEPATIPNSQPPFDKDRDGFVMGEGAGGDCTRRTRARPRTGGEDLLQK